jgi:retron-type reverse transcriptase
VYFRSITFTRHIAPQLRAWGGKRAHSRYSASALPNICRTQDELLSGKFKTKGFYEFDLVERGKPRHVRSVHISERVVQRCVCDNALIPALRRSFIYDNGATLQGRGYDFAVKRVNKFLVEHYRRHGSEGYVLLFDFSKYFDTAQHYPIFEQIERSGLDDRLVSLVEYFIKNFGEYGLGLGSQVSQISAVALPNKIDHYIKDTLRMKYYARYMDDGVIISESKERLKTCLAELRRLCAELGIKLNEKKTQIVKLSRGFTFIKVRFRYGSRGAVIRKVTYKGIKHMREKLRVFRRWVSSGKMTITDVRASLASWRGYISRFHGYFVIQSVERFYKELFAGG